MTISINDSRNEYTATASQTVFSYTFRIFSATDLNVYVTPAGQDANDLNDITTSYTVSGVDDVAGGAITLSSGVNNGDLVTIVSDIPSSRATDYQANGDFIPDTVNGDIDRAVALTKQVEDVSNRSLVAQQSQQGTKPLTLPSPLAGSLMRWKGDLTGFENVALTELDSGLILDQDLIKVFDTVASMVADAGLAVGKKVRTLGYYSSGDGGGNDYEIVAAATGTDDGGSYIDLATHQAKGLFIDSTSYDKQFGTKNDGATDDTDAIQSWLDAGSGIYKSYATAGVCMIEAVTKNINIPTDTNLTFLSGAEWKAIDNASDSYIIMDIRGIVSDERHNVFIYNPVITGERTGHTGGTGEQGHGINISSFDLTTCSNIHIYNPVVTDCWGDGIVIRNGSDLHFYDAYCDNNRRNGITINKSSTTHFHGTTTAINTNGIAPEAGLDIEPNDATGELKDIVFDKLVTANNIGAGCTINIGDFPSGTIDKEVTITISEHHDDGSVYGLNIEKCAEGSTELIAGVIRFGSQLYTNSKSNGVYYNDYAAFNTPKVFMDNLTIINPNADNSSSTTFGVGVNFDRKIGSGLTNDIGNCVITRPTIIDNRASNFMTRGITGFDNDTSGASMANIVITDPLEISGYDADGDAVQVGYTGMQLSDKYNQVGRVLAGGLSVTSRTYSKLETSNASLFTVTDGITKDNSGLHLILESTGTGGIRFDPQAARQVYPLSTVAGKYVDSTSVGALLELRYDLTDDTWYVINQIGTWNVEP